MMKTPVQIDVKFIERARALIPALSENAAYSAIAGGNIKASAVIRLALSRGMEAIESELGEVVK